MSLESWEVDEYGLPIWESWRDRYCRWRALVAWYRSEIDRSPEGQRWQGDLAEALAYGHKHFAHVDQAELDAVYADHLAQRL